MENLNIESTEITWKSTEERDGKIITYNNRVRNHGKYISIHRTMYLENRYIHLDEIHIPLELLEDIKNLNVV